MWSIYDTCILVTGVISGLIAVIPKKDIPVKTRATAAAVGLGLIAASILLGGLQSFRYPAAVFLGPPAALCALVAIGLSDRKPKESGGIPADSVVEGQQPVTHAPAETVARPVVRSPQLEACQEADPVAAIDRPVRSEVPPVAAPAAAGRNAAWSEVHGPATTSERLAEIVGHYPEFASAIVKHPNCYPALSEWARASGLLDAAEQS